MKLALLLSGGLGLPYVFFSDMACNMQRMLCAVAVLVAVGVPSTNAYTDPNNCEQQHPCLENDAPLQPVRQQTSQSPACS